MLAGAGSRQIAVHWQQHGIAGGDGAVVSDQKVRAALISPRMVGYRQHNLPRDRRDRLVAGCHAVDAGRQGVRRQVCSSLARQGQTPVTAGRG